MATHESAAAVRRRDGVAVIDLAGDINGSAEAALDAAWSEATAEPADAVVLNFDGASYINSTGIALIVGLLAKARAGGIEIRAYGLTPHYREIFEITRLADFVAIAADEAGALAPTTTTQHGGNHA
jgi:anti-anti-sigma factor